MDSLVRCKVCGFIIDQSKLGEVCPACGVAKKAFEEYKDRVSDKRRKILDLNLHSMVVHFPQAIAAMVFGLLLISLIMSHHLKGDFLTAVKVLTILLPLSVFAALSSGLLEGKIRFKKLKTPILRLKITVGTIFFLLSLALSFSVMCSFLLAQWIFFFLSGINAILSIILGHNGGKLRGLELPN